MSTSPSALSRASRASGRWRTSSWARRLRGSRSPTTCRRTRSTDVGDVFGFIPGYETHIYNDNKEPLFLLFLALLVTFALTRLYTRLARKRSWGSGSAGGVHLHHVVIGVILMAIGGLLSFTQFNYEETVYNVSAILFGVGLALTLDEFAMIFHMRDVYWAEEGRASIDAILIGAAGAGAVLVT